MPFLSIFLSFLAPRRLNWIISAFAGEKDDGARKRVRPVERHDMRRIAEKMKRRGHRGKKIPCIRAAESLADVGFAQPAYGSKTRPSQTRFVALATGGMEVFGRRDFRFKERWPREP